MNVKQKRKANPILSAVILAIIGVIFLIVGIATLIGVKANKAVDLATCSGSDIDEGTYVSVDLDGDTTYVYGCYAEMQETRYGIFKRSTDKYYLIDACEGAEYFIGIKVSSSLYDEMEDIYDYTYSTSSNAPETLHLVGKVRSQSDEATSYMEDFILDFYYWLTGYTFSSGEISDYYLPYYIDVITPGDYLGPIIIGFILLIIAALIIILSARKKNNVTYTQPAGGYTNPYPYTENPYAGMDMGQIDDTQNNGTTF